MTKRSLLNKTEYHVKSYADLGGRYHSTDNILLELHNGFYYLNTNEIPSELSRENLISSHVKITCYLHM